MNGQHCENFDVKRETVHCYPWNVDRCRHVIRACSWRWPDVVAEIMMRFSKFALVLFCHITSGPNKIHCPPRDQLLSVLRDDCGCHGNDLSPPLSRPHFPSSWSKSPNSSLWLANRAGIRWRYLSLSCPLGFTPCPTWEIWLFISYIKSFTEQDCSVKMAGCWLFFGCLWISTPCQFARKERSQYPAVLTDNKLYLK